MTEKMVSVVIPMYNSEKTIRRALESVINQSYKTIEVIVVNDGSTDNSRNIVEQFIKDNESYNIVLIDQNNSGPSVARNKGIQVANGDYIAFLDSDDYWERDKLSEQVKIMESNPDIYLLGTLKKSNDKRRNIKRSVKIISFYKLLFKNYFTTSSVIVKKEVFQTVGYFNTQKKYSEDYELWLRICYKYKTALYMRELTYYSSEIIGLSSKLVEMEKGELSNYYELYKERKIGLFLFLVVCTFSVIKFFKRLILESIKKIKIPTF